ncbi:unnamed protein product [Onchocerca ochengi]|uniref:RING-type domain-containing protein n=1 Tax=Onchocerca ochengi TaxID=42157 RepID=A0A182ECK9_ONCOC|nr:unnamed protein product [Onchocerca ochengi]
MQASRADTADKEESKLIFCGVAILSAVAITTDIAYNIFTEVQRIGSTGISLLYKLLVVLSIAILNSSVHTIYTYAEALFTNQLYDIINKSIRNYFFISLGLTVLSIKSAIYCFRTITGHTALYAQPITIIVPLRWLTFLAYILITVITIEIVFTVIMYRFFSTKLDLVLGTKLFLWVNTISTCLLQIWICKYERFQRCVIILVVQLISDCLTTLLLIMVQANIVKTVITIMTLRSKTFQHANARIFYIAVDHILQIIQWVLNICSLGVTLIVLDATETGGDDSNEAVDNLAFFSDEISYAPSMNELLAIEHPDEMERTDSSIDHRPATSDYLLAETDNADKAGSSKVRFAEELDNSGVEGSCSEVDNSATKDDNNDGIAKLDNNSVPSTSKHIDNTNENDKIVIEEHVPIPPPRTFNHNAMDNADNDNSSDTDSNIDYTQDLSMIDVLTTDDGDLNVDNDNASNNPAEDD